MTWSCIFLLIYLKLVLERASVLAQTAEVSIYLDPPANTTDGVQSFEYCPTASISVNVTCTVQGIESPLRINPRFGIGSDLFYINNGTKATQWRVMLFSKNHTYLNFGLPLNATADGLNIYCKSEDYTSMNITLLIDNTLCINPTSVIPPSSSTLADGDLSTSSMLSSSTDEIVSSSLFTPSNTPGAPGVPTATVIAAALTSVALLVLLTAGVVVSVALILFVISKRKLARANDPVHYAQQRPVNQDVDSCRGNSNIVDSGVGTLPSGAVAHQGPDSSHVQQETN